MSDTGDMINRRTMLLNAISEALADAVGETDRPYRWEEIPDVLADVIRQRDEAWAEIRVLNAASRDADANVTAHADDLHDAGYAAALDDIETAALAIPDQVDADHRLAFLSGWISGRRAGL